VFTLFQLKEREVIIGVQNNTEEKFKNRWTLWTLGPYGQLSARGNEIH
jgi:hypothetical protein